MTPEQMRQHAEKLIRDHATDIGFLSVSESLETVPDMPDDDDEYDEIAEKIHDLIKRAEITITWPTGGGSDA